MASSSHTLPTAAPTVCPPCFELRTPHIYIEEIERQDFFNMKYHHYHASYEVYYLMEGERYYFIDRRVFHVTAGSLVFIGKNRIHKTSPVDRPYHHRLLFQIDDACFDRWSSDPAACAFLTLFEDELSVIPLSDTQQQIFHSKFEEIKREAAAGEYGFEQMTEHIVWQILLLALRTKISNRTLASFAVPSKQSASGAQTLKEDKIQTVSLVADYLAANYAQTNSLDEIADRFYINKYYLSRIFRQVTGVTMREYLHIQRTQRAMEYLKNSLEPVTEIAHATGFETVSYFEKIFRRYCGMSPKEYRNAAQNASRPSNF